jgi:hypothetical protein
MDVDFLWNIAQHRQIETLDRAAADANETARRAAANVIEIQVALERLSLTCRAMWELLRERTSVSEADLIAKVHEIDLRDGRLDGRARSAAKHCPQCSRVNNSRRDRCLYCGAELEAGSPFSGL